MAEKNRNDLTLQSVGLTNVCISKIYFKNKNVLRGSLDILTESPKTKKDIHTYVPFVLFNPSVELEEGDYANIEAHFFTDSYEDKNKKKHYTLGLCIDVCEVLQYA